MSLPPSPETNPAGASGKPSNVRRKVMLGLFLLSVVTYLDRVCINSAAPEMQRDLGLSNAQWGMVLSAFLAAYGLLEVPGGWLGDRFGPRLVLTRIVVWWSGFTALTGVVSSYWQLLVVRALFGAGEAGAYPNASCVVSRWFPPEQRARAQGIVFMAGRLGGALSPLLVLPLISNWGWRSIFYSFSLMGIFWSAWWWKFFRDYPKDNPNVNAAEIAVIGPPPERTTHIPFGRLIRSGNFWAILGMYHFFCYASNWYLFWTASYLSTEKGWESSELAAYTALPFLLAAGADWGSGSLSDRLVNRIGLKWGRRIVGITGIGGAGLLMLLSLAIQDRVAASIVLALGFAASDVMLPVAWAVCVDVGREAAGTISGAMNTAGQFGAVVMSIGYGILIDTYGWNLPLALIACSCFLSVICWLYIDPSKSVLRAREASQ
ncbi:MAG: MFS transporter [Bryobacterales bacterium]|nr:MFS transporter [Bryobacterales bacterium]